jgi:hypothetical protein
MQEGGVASATTDARRQNFFHFSALAFRRTANLHFEAQGAARRECRWITPKSLQTAAPRSLTRRCRSSFHPQLEDRSKEQSVSEN